MTSLNTVADLVSAGLVPSDKAPALAHVVARYAVAITPAMAEAIDPNNPHDPIALQFIPDERELLTTPEEVADPIGDERRSPVKGIVHRYPDRVLLKLLHVCPVYCRFCFRREVVGPEGDGMLNGQEWETALAYIRTHPELWEVILTGGDPMMLSARRLKEVADALHVMDHIKVLRLHSRVPVVDPGRVTEQMIAALKASGKAVYVAIHANHPNEFTPAAQAACARLVDGGIVLVSQSVLLKGINDDAATLEALMRTFIENRIKPYYLHQGDLAPGTSHWRVPVAEGQALMTELRQRASGLCQPLYMQDNPDGSGKKVL